MAELKPRDMITQQEITEEMIDFNKHLSDVSYHRLFSQAEVAFQIAIGINAAYRQAERSTLYTIESHVKFRREVLEGDRVSISVRIIDHTDKAAHLLMELRNGQQQFCASHECLLLHVKQHDRGPKAQSFAPDQLEILQDFLAHDRQLPADDHIYTIDLRR